MEDPRLTDDQVRELFSAYHDRELSPADHDAVRAALEGNPALQGEYQGFCALMDGLSGLGLGTQPAPGVPQPVPTVDLLQGVHRKLHRRSGGRLFADRWSRTTGIFPLEVIAALVLVGLVAVYVAMTWISARPAGQLSDVAPAPERAPR